MKKIIAGICMILLLVLTVGAVTMNLYATDNKKAYEVQNFKVVQTGSLYQVSGQIYDPVQDKYAEQGLNVKLYCKHDDKVNVIVETTTQENGLFSKYSIDLLENNIVCKSRDLFWLTVTKEGNEYRTVDFMLSRFRSGKKGIFTASFGEEAEEVPEFNTLTLGLAVVFAGLGLALIRRN